MLRKLSFLCCLYSLLCGGLWAQGGNQGSLSWHTNYEQAEEVAKKESKPLLLLFTGSDWCGWCTKLDEEVFSQKEFMQEAGASFVFVKLDFPLYTEVPQPIAAQNKQLRNMYDIRSFPTVIIVDEQGKKVGTTGYRPGGGREYAKHLKEMIDNYRSYQQRFNQVGKKSLPAHQLKSLYEQAMSYHLDNDAVAVLKEGLSQHREPFFLKERFRFLAQEGQIHDKEAQTIKQQLLAMDPANEQHMHYDVAVIEFEAYVDEMEREMYSPEIAVAPLTDYIQKFEARDPESIWRLQMIISQVFLDNNKLPKALHHAQTALQLAPANVKPEIASAIANIERQLGG